MSVSRVVSYPVVIRQTSSAYKNAIDWRSQNGSQSKSHTLTQLVCEVASKCRHSLYNPLGLDQTDVAIEKRYSDILQSYFERITVGRINGFVRFSAPNFNIGSAAMTVCEAGVNLYDVRNSTSFGDEFFRVACSMRHSTFDYSINLDRACRLNLVFNKLSLDMTTMFFELYAIAEFEFYSDHYPVVCSDNTVDVSQRIYRDIMCRRGNDRMMYDQIAVLKNAISRDLRSINQVDNWMKLTI